MSKVNLQDYDLSAERATLNAMDAGKDESTQLDANVVGEVAEVELGVPGKGVYSNYSLFALGGFPDSQLQTREGRADGSFDADDADTPADSNAEIRIALTDKNRTQKYDTTRWLKIEDLQQSNVENLPIINFPGVRNAEWIQEGRVIVVEVRNQNGTVTIDKSSSSLTFPFVGGD